MSDKEERLLFIEINPQGGSACPLLDMSYDLAPVCALTNREAHCKTCRKAMTPAEAIELIAEALRRLNVSEITYLPDWKEKIYRAAAEAALDALIKK